MLQSLMLFAHLVVAALIIVFVLLQRGKGADAGTGFGAGASGTVFGARGSSNFFSRTTAVLAVLFFVTSLTLAYFASQTSAPDSLLEQSVMGEPGQDAGQDGPAVAPPANEPVDDLGLPELDVPPEPDPQEPDN